MVDAEAETTFALAIWWRLLHKSACACRAAHPLTPVAHSRPRRHPSPVARTPIQHRAIRRLLSSATVRSPNRQVKSGPISQKLTHSHRGRPYKGPGHRGDGEGVRQGGE